MHVDADRGPGSANKAAARRCGHAIHLSGLPSITASRKAYIGWSEHRDRHRSAADDAVIRSWATDRPSTFNCGQKSSNKVVGLDRAASPSKRESLSGRPCQIEIPPRSTVTS